jgi:hypothetical protein
MLRECLGKLVTEAKTKFEFVVNNVIRVEIGLKELGADKRLGTRNGISDISRPLESEKAYTSQPPTFLISR